MGPKALSRRALLVLVLGAGWLLGRTQAGRSFLGIRDDAEHPFELLAREGAFEHRAYRAGWTAETPMGAPERSRMNRAFMRLAGYLFARDREGPAIAMTTPVLQGDGKMTFFMPAELAGEDLPAPRDATVSLGPRPAEEVVVYRFSGIPRPADAARHAPALRAWAEGRGLELVGEPRMAYFDPPWTLPFRRRNEVHWSVRPSGA